MMVGTLRFAHRFLRHCEQSEAIHRAAKQKMDCFVAWLLAMTKGALPPALPLARETRNIGRFGFADRRWCPRKARRGGGLRYAMALDKNVSRRHVRMIRRLFHGQDRREADVGTFHDLAPVVARLGFEDLDQLPLQRWPRLAAQLRIEIALRQPRVLAQQCIKLRLDRADRNEPAAGTFIDAIKMRAAVQKIALALVGPSARGCPVEKHRQ